MFFDPEKHVERHQRNLPHWQQGEVISFVTFRLADAIPQSALTEWDVARRIWLLHRLPSAEGSIDEILCQLSETDRKEYLRNHGKGFHDLLDSGQGSCLLRDPSNSSTVETALWHFDGKRYLLGEYVVMPNHVHVLIAPSPEHTTGTIVGSWKRFSAREINRRAGREGMLWQHESFDHLVRSAGSLEGFRKYIRENPIKAGLRPGEFRLGCGSLG